MDDPFRLPAFEYESVGQWESVNNSLEIKIISGQCWDQSDHYYGEYAEQISGLDDPFRLPAFENESAEQWESAELQQEIKPSGSQVHSSIQSDDNSFSDSDSDSDRSDEADSDFDDRRLDDELSLEQHSDEAGETDCRSSGDADGFSDAQGLGTDDQHNHIDQYDSQCSQCSDQLNNQCNDELSDQYEDQCGDPWCSDQHSNQWQSDSDY